MFTRKTTVQEIRDLFRKNEKKQLKDIKILALQYGKAGRGTATDYEGKKVDGISYLRAMDCLFYMLLLKEDIDKYRELIRGKSSILLSIAGFINNKNYTKGIESIEYNYIFDATMELGEIIEILAKIKDKLVNKEEVSEEEQKIRTFSIDRDILLGVIQIDYIIKIINQLSAPVLERYLVADNYSWCREERQIALFLYNILLMKKNNYYEIIEGLNNKKNEEINEGLKEIFEDDFKNIVIHEVYYEAAILRDYFHSLNEDVDRAADFNVSLLEFLLGEDEKANISSIIDKYFEGDKGKKTAKSLTGATSALYKIICSNQIWGIEENDLKYQEDIIDYEKIIKLQKVYFATMIMNAKPDILVVYSNNKKNDKRKRAIVLECKFESNAGMYKDYKNRDTINQELIQNLIMTFLFGKAEKVEEGFDWDDRFIPRFIRDENKENLEHEWKEIYGFYIDIMNNPQTNGMFNEGRDIKTDKKNVILNNGVKEIDFKPKNKTRSNEIVDKISAEDLINFVYCKNV